MSYSMMIVLVIFGALVGAHAKVAPVLGPVSSGILQLLGFLITQSWQFLTSKFQRKPKKVEDKDLHEHPTANP